MSDLSDQAVERLFAGRPEALKLFCAIRTCIESIGSVHTQASRTQVSFGGRTKFAWVWLPQLWVRNRPDTSVTLSFALGRRVDDDRIGEAVQTRGGHWMHHVVIEKESDVDEAVTEWLREAYVRGNQERSSRRSQAPSRGTGEGAGEGAGGTASLLR